MIQIINSQYVLKLEYYPNNNVDNPKVLEPLSKVTVVFAISSDIEAILMCLYSPNARS